MSTKAGVWIDHKQAIVVLATDAGQEIKKIAAKSEAAGRPDKASRLKHSYRPSDFIAEDKLERIHVQERNRFYDEVIACVRAADAILVFGPGEAKGEFSKRIKSKKLRGSVVELETTDKMTDRQIVAKLRKHFAANTPGKKAAPKKAAKKKQPVAAKEKKGARKLSK